MCTLEEITTTPFSIMSYKHKPLPPVNFLKISDKSYFDGKTKTKHTDAKFGCFWPKYDHNHSKCIENVKLDHFYLTMNWNFS